MLLKVPMVHGPLTTVKTHLIGHIHDSCRVEQGFFLSSRQFRLTLNQEINLANMSGLGVQIGQVHVASAGLADDCNLMATNIPFMQAIINITQHVSSEFNYTFVPSKTTVLIINTTKVKGSKFPWIDPESAALKVAATTITPSTQATHLRVIRTTSLSNVPAVLSQIAAHSRSLYGVMGSGLAKNHWSNPAASIRVEAMYCSPVLYNGLASLLLLKMAINTLTTYKNFFETASEIAKRDFSTSHPLPSRYPAC